MSGLDLKRLDSVRLTPRPILQRVVGFALLWPNYTFLPGVRIAMENVPRLGPEPVILAPNHTDRYNYFPLQFRWWWDLGRYTSVWAKGKYFENPLLGAALSRMGSLPTVSRGYMILKDFQAVTGRAPSDAEYRALRDWIEEGRAPSPDALPEPLLTRPRDVLGRFFDPLRETYAQGMNALYALMMRRFVKLHEESFRLGRDLLIFPQGTRSIRLSRGRPGIGQVALHFRKTILPIGISGSDKVYPGALPLGRRGTVTIRFGAPIPFEELAPFHVAEPFEPFTPEAERVHRENFQGVADLVMERIDALVDPPYRFSQTRESDGEAGARRFLG